MTLLARLSVTPVKALGLVHPERVSLEDVGIRENRLFFLVDQDGELISNADHGSLVRIHPMYDPREERLALTFPDGVVVEGAADALGDAVVADIARRPVPARIVEGPLASALSDYAGEPLRLARCDRPGDGPDVHRLTLVSSGSVAELARRGGRAGDLDSRRFRMNLELDGCEPHEEDTWEGHRVEVGDAVILVHGQVPRCVITTRDPNTGVKDFDTLKVIPTYRPLMQREGRKPGIPFGMYAEVEEPGEVSIGDLVEPID